MTDLVSVLAAYYLCNAVTLVRPLTASEMTLCSRTYESVKTHFEPGLADPDLSGKQRRQTNTAAYHAFKAWETQNADTVGEMKRAANVHLGISGHSVLN